MKVLLAEDEKRMNRALCEILRQENYEVTSVENGEDALNVMKEWVPDLVLTDMWMPKMDGSQLAEAMRKKYKVEVDQKVLDTVNNH